MARPSAYALGVCIAAATLGYAAEGGSRFSTELVEVDIGAGYLIPHNYIVNIAPDAEDPELVTMRALWPGLEPLTEENAHLWERRIPERQIHMAILERPRDGYSQLLGFIRNFRFFSKRELRPEPSDFGLIRYADGLQRMFVPADTFYRAPDGSPVVFKCNDETDSVKRSFDFDPICIVEYKLRDGTGLYYRFFMVNLEHWREIDRSVRKLVTSFRS